MMKTKRIALGKFVVRNKPIRKVGIDTNLIFAWMQNERYLGDYRPKFCKQKDRLFINYKVFGELMGLLKEENRAQTAEEIRETIFEFLRKKNISLLKKRFINEEMLDEIIKKLEGQFKDIDRSDLRIIAIFYCFNLDCIFSANNKHFEEPCKFLGTNYERHFEIETGSEQDVKRMLKGIYRGFNKKR